MPPLLLIVIAAAAADDDDDTTSLTGTGNADAEADCEEDAVTAVPEADDRAANDPDRRRGAADADADADVIGIGTCGTALAEAEAEAVQCAYMPSLSTVSAGIAHEDIGDKADCFGSQPDGTCEDQ